MLTAIKDVITDIESIAMLYFVFFAEILFVETAKIIYSRGSHNESC